LSYALVDEIILKSDDFYHILEVFARRNGLGLEEQGRVPVEIFFI